MGLPLPPPAGKRLTVSEMFAIIQNPESHAEQVDAVLDNIFYFSSYPGSESLWEEILRLLQKNHAWPLLLLEDPSLAEQTQRIIEQLNQNRTRRTKE